MGKVKIQESTINLKQGGKGKVAIFLHSGEGDPVIELDAAVNKYVGHEQASQFIDINMDNPWVTVVISHINEMTQEDFNPLKHHLPI